MTFQKYNIRNNAFGRLLAGINASAETMQLNPGEGERFASSNMILTLTQYTVPADTTSEIVKEESVLATNRSGDVFTITRGFGGDTPTSFNTGDWVYLSVRSEHIQDIQDEATRLENDKLNKGGLRTGLANAWRLFFSNGSSNETALAFGDTGRVLQSNGSTSAPTWEVPTVNITGLTTRANPNMNTDEFVVGGNPNEKVTLSQYRATDAEATAGTVTNKFLTPKQAKDNYLQKSDIVNFSRVGNLGSESVNYSHSLGKIPERIDFYSLSGDGSSSHKGNTSMGAYTSGKNYCVYQNYYTSTGSATNNAFRNSTGSSGDYLTGRVTAVSDTNFTIEWTQFNSGTGTVYVCAVLS